MPTVSETLETVFKITGAERLINAFKSVASAANAQTAALAKTKKAQETVGSSLGELAAGYLTYQAILATATRAVNDYADAETSAFRAGVILKNLGATIDVGDLKTLGAELQNLTGVDDDLIVSLGALLARFKLTGDEIKRIIPTIIDVQAATGESAEGLAQTVGRALLGNTRGLKALGIEFTATGDRARDLLEIQKQLSGRFGGAGEAFRGTPGGVLQNFGTSVGNFFEVIGQRSGLFRVIEALALALTGITNAIANFKSPGDFLFDLLGFEPTITNARGQTFKASDPRSDPLSGIGGAGALATESTASRTANAAEETNRKLDPFVRQVLGGKGDVARAAFTHRDARMTFGI